MAGAIVALGNRTVSGASPMLYVATGLSLAAALAHLWLMPEHMAQSLVHGAFFAALALAQGIYGVALLRWTTRAMLSLGAWGTVAAVFLYAVERAVRASLGPHSEHVSSFEVFAMLCTASELGLLLYLLLDAKRLLFAVEALSFGASLVHIWVAQDRYGQWWGFVAFFLAVGLAQGLYCLGLPYFGERIPFLLCGVAGNLSLIALWVATRTVGIPYLRTHGIEGAEIRLGRAEGVGVADLAATTMEVAMVVMLALLAVNLYRRQKALGSSAS